jgi:signal transduction histidine kinase
VGKEHCGSLQAALENYSVLMSEYVLSPSMRNSRADDFESAIRQAGKEIVTIAEEITLVERTNLQSWLTSHRLSLSFSIVALIVLIVVIGQILSRMVTRPLKRMEESMQAVANGVRSQLDLTTQDQEIVSLSNAFNHVLLELDARQTHLVRSEKLASLGTLLSGVAHQLNNPLSNISTSCQILAEELESGDSHFKKELLEQIDDQTERARNIVRSLLDFARDREFTREPLALGPLISETLSFLKGQIQPLVTIITEIPLDISISGDKQRLQQVLLNILKNALDALDGAGEIVIRATPCGDALPALPRGTVKPSERVAQYKLGERAVDLEIRDNGYGIAADTLPHIFDPFFTTKDVGKGSGLGLFVAYEIVEEHGGSIVAESESGKGTVIHIRLPLAQRQA